MINLTPIPQQIQKRLFEKMKELGRENLSETNQSKDTNTLNHTKMATRSTFLRMTSGQTNGCVLMGGKLKEDGTIPGGYSDIYGARTYKTGGKKGTGLEISDFDDLRLLIHSNPKNSSSGTKKPKLLEIAIGGSKEEKLAHKERTDSCAVQNHMQEPATDQNASVSARPQQGGRTTFSGPAS